MISEIAELIEGKQKFKENISGYIFLITKSRIINL